ncbi:hypothetical protein ACWGI1_00040 [Streptomyces sp. NPDC054835]|uniref:hypothetical protein n=1 Tax=Streptomyces exfoliatus TaxID=1905 RepID=UPI0004646063|nr:hypothetical protein [Streptomyces exfoliatus]
MPLFAEEFFSNHLTLPYVDAAVVGDTYYARPDPDLPLRLRIDFADTKMHQRYDGLRMQVVHLERGRIDAQFLSFADYGAFAARDARMDWRPGNGLHGTFSVGRSTQTPEWQGINVTHLRTAIDRYIQVWFPGAPPARTAPQTSVPLAMPRTAAASHRR